MKQTITVLVLVSLYCGAAFGAGGNFGDRNGSIGSPFIIEDAADLFAVNKNMSRFVYYQLSTDIDLAGYVFNQAVIDPKLTGFRGRFDGNGHVIRNLTIQGGNNLGLFGYIYYGTVTDLGLENVNISGVNRTGALAGECTKSTIVRCYSTGSVIGHNVVGGLIGQSTADVYYYVEHWENKGGSRLWNCYSQADVSGNNYVGGLTGSSYKSEIINCYSTGRVGGIDNQGERVGGLVGDRFEGIIQNCYSTATVSGSYYVGGFTGEYVFHDGGTQQTNSFWNTETSGTNTGCGNTIMPGLVGINNVLMAQQSTFGGWNFVNDWQMDTGYYKRPLLRGLLEPEFHNITASAGANGGISPFGDNWYKSGDQLQLTASPDGGYVVDHWYVNSTIAQNGGLTYDVGPVLQDMNINVTFKSAFSFCNVTVSCGGNGDVNPPSGTVRIERGDQLTIKANPAYGYEVDQWKLDGSVYQYGSNTFTLYGTQTNTASISVDVIFEPIMYTVHISSGVPVGNGDVRIGDHGSTAPDGYQQVQQGGDLIITAYPQAGYAVYAWQVNGVMCNHGERTYDLQNVSANMTIGVLFKNTVFADGAGTALNPYQVHDVATLNAVNDEPAANYIMTNNIDLTGEGAYADAVIGIDPSAPFLGVFNGNNKTITGLAINSNNNYLGLFGSLSASNGLQGHISNLTVEGVAIRSNASNIGGLCGLNQSGVIEKCRVVGAHISGDERVAGLCGYNSGAIRYSSAEGSVRGNYRIGLLTGNCYQGTINDCYAIGSLSTDGQAVSGGGISGDINNSTISNCYASCGFDGEGENLGGFCGWSQNSVYDDCVSNQDAYSISVGGGGEVEGITTQDTSRMQARDFWSLTDWDFLGNSSDGTDDIWRMCQDGVDFPRLWWQFSPGDISCGDGVNLVDFAVLGGNWLTNSFDANFYRNADLNNDGVVDISDLVILSGHWVN